MASISAKLTGVIAVPVAMIGLLLIGLGVWASFTTPNTQHPPQSEPSTATGQRLYQANCASCHGLDALGISGLGKSLVGTQFMQNNSDAELIAFIVEGRSATDSANTTGIPMPPRGGNLALSDADIADIVAYLRSLEEPS